MQIFEEIKVIFTHNLYFCAKRNTMQTIEIQEALVQLAKASGYIVTDILPIAESGSPRKYYRIVTETGSVIGTYSTNIEENEAFISFSRHFAEKHLNVPEVLAVSDDRCCYIQNDFGDDNLFNHVQNALRGKGYDEELICLFKMTLKQLVEFQCTGHQGLDYTKAYPSSCFDRQAIIDDLNYFKYYFVKPHQEIVFNETRLNHDFEAFADFVSQAPNDFFMYRDFQSRNIMLVEGEPYYIDFQGGRRGAAQYDVASLLYSAKSDLPEVVRQELLRHYMDCLAARTPLDRADFEGRFYAYVLVRIMQAMGAYGYRGHFERKDYFLASIPLAVANMRMVAEGHPLPIEVPHLQQVWRAVAESQAGAAAPTVAGLVVTVSSFSYKKGLPQDPSGNGGGYVFDCRALPNPGRYPEYRAYTGMDRPVVEFLEGDEAVERFLAAAEEMVGPSIKRYLERNFTSLTVSFGCTGGQHRSVYCAERLSKWISENFDCEVVTKHREQQ